METYSKTLPWWNGGDELGYGVSLEIMSNGKYAFVGFDTPEHAGVMYDKCSFAPELWLTKGRECIERIDKPRKDSWKYSCLGTDRIEEFIGLLEEDELSIKWDEDGESERRWYDKHWLDKDNDYRISIVFECGVNEKEITDMEDLYDYCLSVQAGIEMCGERDQKYHAKCALKDLVDYVAWKNEWEFVGEDNENYSCNDGEVQLECQDGELSYGRIQQE